MEKNKQGVPPNRPVKKYRIGSLSGVLWKNEKDMGDKGIISFLTANLKRSWKDKNTGDWRSETLNLRKSDIPKAVILLNKLLEEMYLNDMEDENE